MADLYAKYVWEVPVRVTHWVTALSVLLLSITGFYIGSPRTIALSASEYVMGWMRFIHFVAGYVFAISVASRVYWSFVGNEYASWRTFFPFLTAEGRKGMWRIFRFYTFTRKGGVSSVGHNEMAGTAYLGVFFVYLVMIVTGFALYSEYAPRSLMNHLFGWLLNMVSNQELRLAHHIGMWLLIGFTIHHVYSAWLMDVKERGGVISGICGGYKSVHKAE